MFKFPHLKPGYKSYVLDISIVFLLLLPLTICNVITIAVGHSLGAAELHDLADKLFEISNLLIGIYPISLCVITTYYLSIKRNIGSFMVVPYALVMFMTISIMNGLISPQGLPNSALLALVSAGFSSFYCSLSRFNYLDPSKIDFAQVVYKQAIYFSSFMFITAILSKIIESILSESTFLRENIFIDPFTFLGGLTYQFILGVLGAVGINGHNFLFSVKQKLYEETLKNITAWEHGEMPLNILNQGFYDAFMSIGGSGNSLSLLLCILFFSRNKQHISIAIGSIPLVIFNINELLLFGLPIIFNPILIIPFILVPMVNFILVYLAIATGLVNPVSAIVDWMTPPLLSGYLATQNSIGGVILQLFVILLGVIIYRPFYMYYSGKYLLNTQENLTKEDIERSSITTFVGDLGITMSTTLDKYQRSRRVNTMLSKGKFVMFYQPQVHLKDKEFISLESLVRYVDQEGNIIPPVFINDFLQVNAIQHLDKIVIDLVLKDMQKLCKTSCYKVSINISPETISSSNIVEHITNRLNVFDVPASALEIEITEEAILEKQSIISENINRLQALGVHIAIDDFGAGYASFPHLLKFNFDKVKLDRSLLLSATEEKGQNLYQLLARISEVTGCILVSEGIETKEEENFVATCGIDICQGFLFSKPMPLPDTLKWIKNKNFDLTIY